MLSLLQSTSQIGSSNITFYFRLLHLKLIYHNFLTQRLECNKVFSGDYPYKYGVEIQHFGDFLCLHNQGKHPLMMEADTVFRTMDCSSILTRLIPRETFMGFYRLESFRSHNGWNILRNKRSITYRYHSKLFHNAVLVLL
jgi:hypothetical protein